MLVLSRFKGQRIIIDRTITVEVLSTHNGQVRLGITAPREKSINREEIELLKTFKTRGLEQVEC